MGLNGLGGVRLGKKGLGQVKLGWFIIGSLVGLGTLDRTRLGYVVLCKLVG
jgi:hypothetical protein